MADEPQVIEEEAEPSLALEGDSSALLRKLSLIKARCEAAKIDFGQHVNEEGSPYATIAIQAGRNKRTIYVSSEQKADALLSVAFEKYRFLARYEAICSYGDKLIEAGLTSNQISIGFVFDRLRSATTSEGAEAHSIELVPAENLAGRPTVEIGPCSREFKALFGSRGPGAGITLKLKGMRASQHDHALAELRAYADSLFFQMDNKFGAAFALERERRHRFLSLRRRPVGFRLEYPVAHYNEEAMSLYWYAKSARNMPLLRFLAFYQSIEFFFPRFSQTETRRRAGAIVKSPTFRPYSDDDLDRLISAIQAGRSGMFANERSQLRSVVMECVSADDVREFLSATKERESYFAGKTPKYHRIALANKSADLRTDAADRIYDIRCKIVHTKNEHSDEETSMILPFSEDADQLLHDIDLVEYLATRVLVSSSSELF